MFSELTFIKNNASQKRLNSSNNQQELTSTSADTVIGPGIDGILGLSITLTTVIDGIQFGSIISEQTKRL